MKPYDKDYTVYDEFGISQVNCMICGDMVKKRAVVFQPDPRNPGETIPVLALEKLHNFRTRTVEIETDLAVLVGKIDLIVCDKCLIKPIDGTKLKKQLLDAWEIEQDYLGRSQEEKDKYKDKMSKIKLKG